MRKDLGRDVELAEQAATDKESFGKLYDLYYEKVYSYIGIRVGNIKDAEDLTAQTFEKVLKSIDSYNPKKASPITWIMSIASNLVIDFYRRKGKRKLITLEGIKNMYFDRTELDTESIERHIALVDLIKELPRQHQEILLLKYFMEQSTEEIMNILDCSRGTCSRKLVSALEALRRRAERESLLDRL